MEKDNKSAITETPAELQEVIQKILDSDAAARNITVEAKSARRKTEKEIAEKKIKLREDYLEKANERIEKMRIEERKIADEVIAKAAEEHEKQLEHLEKQYREGKAGWVDEVFRHTVYGE